MINAVAVVQEFYRAMGAGVEHIAALLLLILSGQGQKASRIREHSSNGAKCGAPHFVQIAGEAPRHRRRRFGLTKSEATIRICDLGHRCWPIDALRHQAGDPGSIG
jgi:hypothetical protein